MYDTTQFIQTDEQAPASAAARMRALGYFDAHVTRSPSDGSIDVRSSRAVAAVQRRASPAHLADLHILVGSAATRDGDKELWFFVASGYTQSAVEYANDRPVFLFTYSVTGELTPVNQIARDKLAGRYVAV